jgi:hypothetical protein
MREIKFRAWVVAHGKFTSWENAVAHDFAQALLTQPDFFIPMQYTGFKDINGTEIYDGDILEGWINGFPVHNEVHWHDGAWWAGTTIGQGFLKHNEVQVIGNIYENPELLTPGLSSKGGQSE